MAFNQQSVAGAKPVTNQIPGEDSKQIPGHGKSSVDQELWYDKAGESIIRFLRSKFNALSTATLLIILQTFHPAKVLYSFNLFEEYPGFNYFYCYFLAFFIEIFIIYYVVKENGSKRFSMSLWFCIFSIAINLYYYVSHLCLVTENDVEVIKLSYKLIPAAMFSIVIPLAVYRVSEKINLEV